MRLLTFSRLLHAGHILLFSASKQQGDILIVATDDDASVQRLKGNGRPVIDADQRVRILNAIDSIDYVVVFSSEELKEIIETVRPDILTKGSNYTENEVAEHALVEQLGGRVVLIPVSEEHRSRRRGPLRVVVAPPPEVYAKVGAACHAAIYVNERSVAVGNGLDPGTHRTRKCPQIDLSAAVDRDPVLVGLQPVRSAQLTFEHGEPGVRRIVTAGGAVDDPSPEDVHRCRDIEDQSRQLAAPRDHLEKAAP